MSLDLDAIRARYNSIQEYEQGTTVWTLTVWRSADDTPALLAELERMRAELDDTKRAHGAAVGTGQIWESAAQRLHAGCPAWGSGSGYVHIGEGELERMQTVVEMANAWRGQPWLARSASRRARATNALIAAVDALEAGATTGDATP